MEQISLDEIRKIQTNILKEFAAYCDRNNLRYYLDAGTLLGAVRHKGFIPWDDDIDVCMPRPDYERLVEISGGRLTDKIEIYDQSQSIYVYMKIIDNSTYMEEFSDTYKNVLGVYIDVFPKDGLPDRASKSRLLCKIVDMYTYKYWFNKYSIFKWQYSGQPRKFIAFCGRKLIRDKERPLRTLTKLCHTYKYESSPYVATIVAGGLGNCVERECFEEFVMLDFEGLKFKAPVGYDTYLRTLYKGDYMIPPPPEKRIRHDNIAFYKDKP